MLRGGFAEKWFYISIKPMKTNNSGGARFVTGVCWYPEQWREELWRRDAENMRDAGIGVVRLGEFAWSRLQPAPDEWRPEWLRRALDILHNAGLRAVLGTPSAAPPKWLHDKFPDMARIGEDGVRSAFGSRRWACLAHAGYVRACLRVAGKMAREFGEHPAVVGWQIDNEYGCHDTARSCSAAAAVAFRRWLRLRYGDIATLNAEWGNAFWSMEYGDFSEIDPPHYTPAGHNPALLINFRRFWSQRIRLFNWRQAAIVRRHSPNRDIFHCFMGFSDGFDHFPIAADMDIATWNSYPLGFLARAGEERQRLRYMRLGHPDYAAFHHDLYRACGNGRMWVSEQQPGPVNWAAYNPTPMPGAVRFWTWEAFAHGAEAVCYFRWRQAAKGQEQMHAGLMSPDDSPTPALAEAAQVAREAGALPAGANDVKPCEVALVFDYASLWFADIQPHGDIAPFAAVMDFYSALRRAGVDVDIVAADADFAGRKLVVAPLLVCPPDDFAARLHKAGCVGLFGPRCGSRTADFAIPPNLPPGVLQDALGVVVQSVDSLPPEISAPVVWDGDGDDNHAAIQWRELARPQKAKPVAAFKEDGYGAAFVCGKNIYLACRPNSALLDKSIRYAASLAKLQLSPPPPDIRRRRRGELEWLFNYGDTPSPLPPGEVIIGEKAKLPPGAVAAVRITGK